MANEQRDRPGEGGDASATTGGGASTDRGGRDAGTPGPDPSGAATGPGTGSSKRYVPPGETDALKAGDDRGDRTGAPTGE